MQGSRASLSTMDGLASANIKPSKSIVIIDEAGTVPEYKLPLLLNMNAEAIVAIGDQNQLQPFSHASKDGDTTTQDGFPAICELVSNQFYKGKLITGDHVKAMRLRVPAGGITWLDYPEIQAESTDRLRMCNMVEVDLLGAFMCDELPALLSQGKSVAVITFYKQQFLELIKMGEACGTVKTREQMKNNNSESSRFTHPNFRIVTVDAAQGSEADVILLSCVRCNRQRNIGFIKDKNRLCVALSRARERLIVVGSRATLAVDPVWRAVMASTTNE
jgi:superfamily I DNA and/or RNA helicase